MGEISGWQSLEENERSERQAFVALVTERRSHPEVVG